MKKIIFSGLLYLILPSANAQQADSITNYDLEEVSVAATRMNLRLKDIPQKVEIIDQNLISSVPSENVAELLKRTTNLDIVQYTGLSATIGMRGFSPSSHARSYTLLLINGKPSGTVNLATVNTAGIERIEVIKGPYSALYGSDAMGGVINIITKDNTSGESGSVSIEAGSFGTMNLSGYIAGEISKKTSFSFGYTRKDQQKDYRIGSSNLLKLSDKEKLILDKASYNDEMRNSKYQISHINGKLSTFINKIWESDIEVLYSFADDIETPGNYWGSYGTNKKDFTRLNVYGNLSRSTGKNTFNLTPYYTRENNFDYSSDADSGFINFNSKVQEYGFKMQDNMNIGKFNFMLGMDLDIHNYQSERFNAKAIPTNPYSPNHSNAKSAIFAQAAYKKNGLFINAGARFDVINYKISENELLNGTGGKESYQALNPSAGIQYTFPFNLKLHGSFGTAFSVPDAFKVAGSYNVSEYFADWDFWWISNYKGNPDLKPESSTTRDLGVSYSHNNKLFYNDITYFQTHHKDKIVEYVVNDTTTFKNADNSKMSGIEWIASSNLGNLFDNKFKLDIYANFTYNLTNNIEESFDDVNGNDSTTIHQMLYTRKSLGNFGIFFDNYKGFSTRLNARYSGSRLEYDNFSLLRPGIISTDYYSGGGYIEEESTLNMPDFLIVDYSVFYTINDNKRFGITISNLLDENYSEKDGYNMPGRMITGSFSSKF